MERVKILQNQLNLDSSTVEISNTSNDHKLSVFESVKLAPPDQILGVNAAFKLDTNSKKVNLSIGAYRTDDGLPFVLRSVEKIEETLSKEKLNKEYSAQDGLQEFNQACQKFLLGEDSSIIKEKKICTLQSLSGTGAIRLGVEFIKRFLPKNTLVYVPSITWGNHFQILDACNVSYEKYPYWDAKTKGLDLKGMINSLENAPIKSVVLLHSCAHNPTGVDPTEEEWKKIAIVCKKRDLLVFFDNAYQGFASGDLVKDAFSIRYFASQGFEMFCAQSFAKNFGLYGERIGAFHIISSNPKTIQPILTQMHIIVRTLYSSPPLHGARIVSRILLDPSLFKLWEEDLKIMSNRIMDMRKSLFDELKKKNTPGDWSHVVKQIGMFSFTGLSPEQCDRMVSEFHIYMLRNGRISMAGLNSKNVAYVAQSIHACVSK